MQFVQKSKNIKIILDISLIMKIKINMIEYDIKLLFFSIFR